PEREDWSASVEVQHRSGYSGCSDSGERGCVRGNHIRHTFCAECRQRCPPMEVRLHRGQYLYLPAHCDQWRLVFHSRFSVTLSLCLRWIDWCATVEERCGFFRAHRHRCC